jgi:phosphoglucosamine mutase
MFGTDGIRGQVGCGPITPEGFLKLGWALGKVLSPDGPGQVVIGRDTRLSGSSLSLAFSSGLLSAGLDVIDVGILPTPAVAYLTKSLNARAGVVISASHNQYMDNGVKFFDHQGLKFAEDVEQAISHCYTQPVVVNKHCGRLTRADEAAVRYLEHLKSLVSTLDLNGLSIALDMANGAGYQVGPRLLSELGAQVTTIANEPDGLNINDDCGATALSRLQRTVTEHRCEIGVALDGDGDRLMLIDNTGAVVDGDAIVYILAKHWKQKGLLKGGVVGTLMSNLGQEQSLLKLDIPFERANVGDVHVMTRLRERAWNLGGESSGHVICFDHATTGDGLLTALLLLQVMHDTGQSLATLANEMPAYPSVLVNVPCPDPKAFIQSSLVEKWIARHQKALGRQGRILVRASGTEPLIRVMVEGPSINEVQSLSSTLVSEVTQMVETTSIAAVGEKYD